MKVAIPSNDHIKISQDFLSSKGFLIFELDDHSLVNYYFRENPYCEDKSIELTNVLNVIDDCNSIICTRLDKEINENLKKSNKQVLKTLEENAKRALINLMCRV